MVLYAERGYEETTVAEIAERAGLTKRTFFRHFADKREVLFGGSEVLEQEMTAAIEAAPADAPPVALIGAALDAAGARFEGTREFAALRHAIVTSSPELQERELIKASSLAAAMTKALSARGLDDTAATLAAWIAMSVMHVSYERWAPAPDGSPYQQIARDALAKLKEITAAGLAIPHPHGDSRPHGKHAAHHSGSWSGAVCPAAAFRVRERRRLPSWVRRCPGRGSSITAASHSSSGSGSRGAHACGRGRASASAIAWTTHSGCSATTGNGTPPG